MTEERCTFGDKLITPRRMRITRGVKRSTPRRLLIVPREDRSPLAMKRPSRWEERTVAREKRSLQCMRWIIQGEVFVLSVDSGQSKKRVKSPPCE
jgi:hypothetical protein